MLIPNGRVGKWIPTLFEFDLRYELAKVVKGQIMDDFVTRHHGLSIRYVEPMPWTLFFDGSSCRQGGGIGIIIISPRASSFEYVYSIKQISTSNKAEYEAILKGLQLFQEVKVDAIEIFRDSQLIINQLISLYECKDDVLRNYYEKCWRLIYEFRWLPLGIFQGLKIKKPID
jgi:hypothetical protein